MVESNKNNIDSNKTSVDVVFEQHKKEKRTRFFITNKLKVFILGILSGFVIVVLMYFLSDFSKVKGIKIEGNYFLSKDEVLELSGLNMNSRYLLIFDSMIESKIKTSPFVESAKINVKSDGTIYINILEKKIIGYTYVRYPEIVFGDATLLEMEEKHTYLLSKIPLIVGFDENIEGLSKSFKDVEQAKIESISEIHRFEYSYDPNGIELVLKDGNRFFASFYSISFFNQYNSIASVLTDKNVCLYAVENTTTLYQSECPEDIVDVEAEGNEDVPEPTE